MYAITASIISIIAVALAIYIGHIWMIDESMDTINKIDIQTGPPPSEYYPAYQWIKWASDRDVKKAFYKSKNSLSKTFGDFKHEFQTIFLDSVARPIQKEVWSKIDYEQEQKISKFELLKLFHKPYYDIIKNPIRVSQDFLKRKLQLPLLDRKEYEYLFNFMTKSQALQNNCKAWFQFLELYAQEEKDSSALNCCQDILTFRPDS